MRSCELVTLITALACSIAKDRSTEDINLLSVIFSQLGDTLATIAVNEDNCQSNKEVNSSER